MRSVEVVEMAFVDFDSSFEELLSLYSLEM